MGYKLSSEEWTITNDQLSTLLQGQDPFTNFIVQGREYPIMEMVPQVVSGLINPLTLLNQESVATSQDVSSLARASIADFKKQIQAVRDQYQLWSARDEDMDLIALTIYNLLVAEHQSLNIIVDDPVTHQSDLVQEVAYIDPEFIVSIQDCIRSFMDQLGIKVPKQDSVLELLVFYLIAIWPNMIEELNHDKMIDLFLYTGNYNYDLKYKSYLEPAIHNYVRIHVQDGLAKWPDLLEENKYQIILSSYYVPPAADRYVYNIQAMPDVETITWLYQTIRKINDDDISEIDQNVSNRGIRLV